MTLLATLYPAYNSTDFDLEAAVESPKRLVITWEDAVQWAEAEMAEGRGEPLKWERAEYGAGGYEGGRWQVWKTECNENNEPEEWILVVEDVPFAKF